MTPTRFISFGFHAVLLLIWLLSPIIAPVHADESFRTDYAVDYYLGQEGGGIKSSVTLTTTVTNKQEDVYIDKYAVAFPESFQMSQIKARDDHGPIEVEQKQSEGGANTLTMQFNEPAVGSGKSNHLYLTFDQHNLFQVNGNVWEVLLPTMQKTDPEGDYVIRVHLPDNDKKLSIAKPKPTSISQNTITWSNPTQKTIIAVFGTVQAYEMSLTYRIKNDRLVPVVTDVAFPPNTTYQEVLVHDINPRPESITIDEDGNYLGRYRLLPRQSQKITFTGQAHVYVSPREDEVLRSRQSIKAQRPHLLASTRYWDMRAADEYDSPRAIYDSVVKTFTYNYERINQSTARRMGASAAFKNPTLAVCAEFTDAFVSLNRSIGVPAREIEGYGFSQDERLRPRSLEGDILHAWPEYWNEQAARWEQVDPTWENTSGIDYFSSFDLNHIAFVIHGKEDDYPVPAGMYKIGQTQDVVVEATANLAKPSVDIKFTEPDIQTTIHNRKVYTGYLAVTNQGNSYAYNIPVSVRGDNIQVQSQQSSIAHLAPFQTAKVPFTYQAVGQQTTFSTQKATITAEAEGAIMHQEVTIDPYLKSIAIYAALGGVMIVVILLGIRIRKRKRPPEDAPQPPSRPINNSLIRPL